MIITSNHHLTWCIKVYCTNRLILLGLLANINHNIIRQAQYR